MAARSRALLVSAVVPLLAWVAHDSGAQVGPSIQSLVDAAQPGATVLVQAGTYAENVVIEKPLVLRGEPAVVIDGGDGPALTLSRAQIRVENLTVVSSTTAIVMRDAPAVDLWLVRTPDPRQATADNVTWVRIVSPPREELVQPRARSSTIVHLHAVDLRVERSTGQPYGGADVRLLDEGREAFRGRTDAMGWLRATPVASSHATYGPDGAVTDAGSNETFAYIGDERVDIPLEPGVHELTIELPAPPTPGGAAFDVPPAVVAGIAAALSLAVVATVASRAGERWRWWWHLLWAPLYTRLARATVLEHGLREAVYGYVEANPGSHLRQMQRDLNVKYGTLVYHVRVLLRQRCVRSVRDGIYLRFYPMAAPPPAGQGESLADMVDAFLRQHPGCTNAQVAAALARRPTLIHYHVERLAERGRARKERHGREVWLFPVEPGSYPARG